MKHGSLFSGIGGFDLAAEWMGWENIFHCEWNEFGQKILKYYWPDAISYTDITKTDFSVHRGQIDIITGGFPCQPYSQAGKRKGKEDDRHLWPEMLRAIREIQPAWVVGENVSGLLNWSGGMVLAEIKADLEGAGFEVFPPCILPACGKDAPHRRDRLWIVAYNTTSRNINKREVKEVFREKQGTNTTRVCNGDAADTIGGGGKQEIERKGGERVGERDQIREVGDSNGERWPAADTGHAEPQGRQIAQEGQQHDGGRHTWSELAPSGSTPNATDPGGEQLQERTQIRNGQNTEKERTGMDDRIERPGDTRDAADIGIGRMEGYGNSDGHPELQTTEFDQDNSNRKPGKMDWRNFPTQPPVCSRDDGLSAGLAGITVSKHRTESIKAYGNSIVPQVVYEIFKAIDKMEAIIVE